MDFDSPSFRIPVAISDLLRRYALHILIFLGTLFFVLTISNPAVFINDEWITLNQLRQIDESHQLITNEGTYGVFKDGTSTPYFDYRNRFLAYTLMLPILSFPALKVLSFFGDQFRYIIVLLWAVIPILMMCILEFYYPQYARYRGIRWTYIVFLAMGILLFLNFSVYYTFPFTGPTSPREIAAVVFTQHLLLAMMAVVIFSTFMIILKNSWASIYGTIVAISSSSYIFWAANGKDHLLVAAVFSLCVYFMVRYLIERSYSSGALAFIFIGLLAWARTEFGFIVFLISALFIVIIELRLTEKRNRIDQTKRIFLPLFTIIGAIPLFLNNIYMNGNPFIPTSLVYMQDEFSSGILENISSGQHIVASSGLLEFPLKIIKFFSIQWGTLSQDLWGIIFLPENGVMGVLSVAPLLLLVLVSVPAIFYWGGKKVQSCDMVKIYLSLMILAVLLTYMGEFHGIVTSLGVAPDLRYFSPVYLPIALLGMMLIYFHLKSIDWKKWVFITLTGLCFIIPLIYFTILWVFPTDGSILGVIRFFNPYSIVLLVLFLAVFMGTTRKKISDEYVILFLSLLISSPLAWQIMMSFVFSIAKFNGYPFWIPIVEFIFSQLFSIPID